MDSSTRISDLPDMTQNGGGGSPFSQQSGFGVSFQGESGTSSSQQPSYIPMNIHPNPYGNQPPTAMMPPPQYTQSPPKLNGNSLSFHNGGGEMMPQQTFQHQQPSHPMPSRDIATDITSLTIDERIQPNYVPPPSKQDYIHEDAEEEEERKLKRFRNKEKRVRFVDNTFVEIQKPVIIALLFMLFQLPFMNAFLTKYLFFLGLYGDDGAINMLGHTFKSVLFGALVYSLDYLMSLME